MSFTPDPKARASFAKGTIYAVCIDDNIFYCQVAFDKTFAFFRLISKEVLDINEILENEIMSRISISLPSVKHGLRGGMWKKLGKGKLKEGLDKYKPLVMWSVGRLTAEVFTGHESISNVDIFSPDIQSYDISMVYDAVQHVPERLKADYWPDKESIEYGGTVWRMRKLKEYRAKKFPDLAHHKLPDGWIYTEKQI